MDPELAARARSYLAPGDGPFVASTGVAERATVACERLAQRLSSLVGDHGVSTLFKRGVSVVNRECPRFAGADPWTGDLRADDPWVWLRRSMEMQDSETATEAFVLVLSVVVDLLGRLVGEDVVECLLRDEWSSVFPLRSQENR
jgi:hypothetical protein